jgi:hypothetical protein
MPNSQRELLELTSRRHTGAMALVAIVIWFGVVDRSPAHAAPLKIAVDGNVYLVDGDAVSAEKDGAPLDAPTTKKAQFTARVLDQQILHSSFNKQILTADNRATVFAAERSGRLLEPWQRTLGNGAAIATDATLTDARERYKTWATKLMNDPGELRLAIARQDYLDGIGAFRETAAICRNVVSQGQILTYEDAVRLMRNQWPTIRLTLAKALEERLSDRPSKDTDQAGLERLRQRLSNDVTGRIDSDVKTIDDLAASAQKFRAIASSDPLILNDRAFGDYVKELTGLSVRLELWAAAYSPEASQ